MSVSAATTIAPLLRIEDVLRILSISRSQLYDLIRIGYLPAPIKLGKCAHWSSADISSSDIIAAISR